MNPSSSTPQAPDKSNWGIEHFIVDSIQPLKGTLKAPPVFAKEDPLPVLTERSCHVFILSHALWPVLVAEVYMYMTGARMPAWATIAMYIAAYYNMMFREAKILHRMGRKVGYLDGDAHKRDRIPFHSARKVLFTVTFFATTRPCLTLLATYWDADKTLPSLSLTLPLKLLLYPIITDLWFYLYHRACHEVPYLWRYHRTHHLTKHPIPILASYSDIEQETIEVILVPLLTYFCMKPLHIPLSFQEWWICQAYILFEEVMGHSGLRVYAVAPAWASPALRAIGCELVVEDHDLHHRNGWRKSFNYGKQTRLWDWLGGTVAERIESEREVSGEVSMQWF